MGGFHRLTEPRNGEIGVLVKIAYFLVRWCYIAFAPGGVNAAGDKFKGGGRWISAWVTLNLMLMIASPG